MRSAATRSGLLPRMLNWIGVLVGLAGILTVVPSLGSLTDVFGLGQILWFIYMGAVMLSKPDWVRPKARYQQRNAVR